MSNLTKKQLAMLLDMACPLFFFNTEHGLTSYHNYTKDELISHCLDLGIAVIQTN